MTRFNQARVRAIVGKELRDYRRNNTIVIAMALLPVIFVIQPLASVFSLPAASALTLRHKVPLLYMLGIPALVPAAMAAAAVVTERQLGTLEPILTTPIRSSEFLIGKALAVLVPAVGVSYLVFAASALSIELFAAAPVAAAVLRAPELVAQFVFTPLLATWSIWVGIAISCRISDIRAAQQLSVLGSLPPVVLAALIAFGVIHASGRLAVGLGVLLLAFDLRGYRVVSAMFDRERLITGTRE